MTDRFLPTALRRALEKTVKAARDVAEAGAADAVRRLGVSEATAPAHLNEDAKALRRRLRAHARTLGDMTSAEGAHEVRHLVEATGYAQWHRRLFARFLAERGLLRHPEHGPVTLEDCEELAKLEDFADAWSAAEAYGAKMLPGVFMPDDPVLALEFAPEHAQALRHLVDGLDPAIFQADDALGWTYQFWRAAEKDRVNKAGEKIGASDLPAVTQLFTEPYMVKFLLHNTLGAWRAGKVLAARPELAANAADEAELRAAVSPPGYAFDMLRFVRDGEDASRWRPAAGNFSSWPETAAEIRALDPCCGSGHFLTEVLTILSSLRADEEGMSSAASVAAVLRDNLFGLELDGRCVQIAVFAVALTAWRIGGFQPFGPEQVHVAWVGAPPPLDRADFLALANGDDELRLGLAALHDLFVQAPLLGSLIDPTGGDLMSTQRLGRIEPLLDRLVEKSRAAEPERAEGAVAARGMADAADLLSQKYTIIATNVPFLGRGKQDRNLAKYIESKFRAGKADMATAMLIRALAAARVGGTIAVVSPQNWSYLGSYKEFRSRILQETTLNFFVPLGEEAWEEFGNRGPLATLTAFTKQTGRGDLSHFTLDTTDIPSRLEKISSLSRGEYKIISQQDQVKNPDHRISSHEHSSAELLSKYAGSYVGFQNGDTPRWVQNYWEQSDWRQRWSSFQTPPPAGAMFSGCDSILRWDQGKGPLAQSEQVFVKGREAWGKPGILIRQMRDLSCSVYLGGLYDQSGSVISPKNTELLGALWCFCSGAEFPAAVRRVDSSVAVTNATFVKVPFDADVWRRVASERYPTGIPEPYSDDPTQWLFHGHPAQALPGTQLHVALARLAGYRWPGETDPEMRLSAEARGWLGKSAALPPGDNDGLLSLEAVAGEPPLAQRLRAYLAAAFGEAWSEALERRLVAEADQNLDKKAARDGSVEAWLRDRAFRQHCRLFQDRPFLWHVWDGSPDGFSAFVHYHRLDTAALGKLTYTVLGDWIARMSNTGDARRVEAAKILQQKLTAILGGEEPFDIFVRWKSLEHQPIGWDPDVDDGVRLNIRPFVKAGVLRETPKIRWGVDRGSDATSAPWFSKDKGKRNNDHHLKLADKQAARGAK